MRPFSKIDSGSHLLKYRSGSDKKLTITVGIVRNLNLNFENCPESDHFENTDTDPSLFLKYGSDSILFQNTNSNPTKTLEPVTLLNTKICNVSGTSTNFDAYLSELGVNFILQNLAKLAKPTVSISRSDQAGQLFV